LQGGIYFFQLVDHFAASISIMYLAFFEVIAISWFYGAHRLAKNVREMTGRLPSQYIQFCWWVAAPALLMVSLHSHIREDNIKTNLHEVGWGGEKIWTKLGRDRWPALVNVKMNLRVPYSVGNFLTS